MTGEDSTEKIVRGDRFEHEEHGEVTVMDMDELIVSVTPSSEEREVHVQFRVKKPFPSPGYEHFNEPKEEFFEVTERVSD